MFLKRSFRFKLPNNIYIEVLCRVLSTILPFLLLICIKNRGMRWIRIIIRF